MKYLVQCTGKTASGPWTLSNNSGCPIGGFECKRKAILGLRKASRMEGNTILAYRIKEIP